MKKLPGTISFIGSSFTLCFLIYLFFAGDQAQNEMFDNLKYYRWEAGLTIGVFILWILMYLFHTKFWTSKHVEFYTIDNENMLLKKKIENQELKLKLENLHKVAQEAQSLELTPPPLSKEESDKNKSDKNKITGIKSNEHDLVKPSLGVTPPPSPTDENYKNKNASIKSHTLGQVVPIFAFTPTPEPVDENYKTENSAIKPNEIDKVVTSSEHTPPVLPSNKNYIEKIDSEKSTNLGLEDPILELTPPPLPKYENYIEKVDIEKPNKKKADHMKTFILLCFASSISILIFTLLSDKYSSDYFLMKKLNYFVLVPIAFIVWNIIALIKNLIGLKPIKLIIEVIKCVLIFSLIFISLVFINILTQMLYEYL